MARTKTFDQTEVLDKALELFWKKGYNGTSIQDLVRHLGLNRSSLYDTFGDKYTLYMAALTRYRDQSEHAMGFIQDDSLSIKDRIRKLFQSLILDLTPEGQDMGCFMVNSTVEMAAHDPQIRNIAASNMDQVEKTLSQQIEIAQQKGEISQTHTPIALSKFLMNTIMGMQVNEKARKDKGPLKEILEVAMSILDH